MTKVIILVNQPWAKKAVSSFTQHPRISEFIICNEEEDLYLLDLGKFDVLITIGLSRRLNNSIYESIFTIGLHCAELDRYSAGTPLQNQIIDGIVKTKHRIFPIRPVYDNVDSHVADRQVITTEYSHQIDLCLHGNMQDIFNQLTYTTIALINLFLDDFPENIVWKNWEKESIYVKRRVVEDSTISLINLKEFTTLKLYNLIRSLGDPYPNFAIEDEHGILYIKSAEFKSKK